MILEKKQYKKDKKNDPSQPRLTSNRKQIEITYES